VVHYHVMTSPMFMFMVRHVPSAPEPPPPDPPPTRPFAAPTTTQTVTVPSSIDGTGATDVSTAFATWIATVPNGSVVSFPSNKTYKFVGNAIRLQNRHHLVFEGNGSVIWSSAGSNTLDSCFLIDNGSSDIRIEDFTLRGANTATATALYQTAVGESSMGVSMY